MFWVTTCRASEVLAHAEKVKASRLALCCVLWDTHKAVIYWNKLIQPSAQQSMLQLLLLFCCVLKQHLIVLSMSLCHTPSGTPEFCCVSEFFSFSLLMQETAFNESCFLASSHTSVYPQWGTRHIGKEWVTCAVLPHFPLLKAVWYKMLFSRTVNPTSYRWEKMQYIHMSYMQFFTSH